MRSIRLASGASDRYLRQAARIERALEAACPGTGVIAVPVPEPEEPQALLDALGQAVERGEADAAVCPARLMSGGLPPGMEVGAFFNDGACAYRWISAGRSGPGALAHGARVVTWDDVARAQLLYRYPSLEITSARGWERVFEGLRLGTWGGACLPPEAVDPGALWGLESAPMAEDEVIPAIGQGAATVLVPAGAEDSGISLLNDPGTELRLRLESIFWRAAMEVPSTVATALVRLVAGRVRVEGLVAEADGLWMVTDSGEAEERYGDFVAADVAQSCLEMAWGRRTRGLAAPVLAGRAAS